MRTIIIALFIILFAICSIVMLPVLWIIGKFNPKAKQRGTQKIVQTVFKAILFMSGVKKTVLGLDRVPTDRSVLFAINHRGFYDVILALATVPVPSAFVSKVEIKKIPGLRTWMRNLKCVFLDRKNPREGLKAILQGIENIKEGTSMFISPEGTRNHSDILLPFKPGSLKMAEKIGCPIVPVAITNADQVLENHIPWIRGAKMTIEYGEPIYVGEMSAEEKVGLYEHARNSVQAMLEKNA